MVDWVNVLRKIVEKSSKWFQKIRTKVFRQDGRSFSILFAMRLFLMVGWNSDHATRCFVNITRLSPRGINNPCETVSSKLAEKFPSSTINMSPSLIKASPTHLFCPSIGQAFICNAIANLSKSPTCSCKK